MVHTGWIQVNREGMRKKKEKLPVNVAQERNHCEKCVYESLLLKL